MHGDASQTDALLDLGCDTLPLLNLVNDADLKEVENRHLHECSTKHTHKKPLCICTNMSAISRGRLHF